MESNPAFEANVIWLAKAIAPVAKADRTIKSRRSTS
mgnify:FL=1